MELVSAPVIGPIGPRPDGLDAPFWDGLAGGRLMLQRCGACCTWIWGPQPICPACRHPGPGWEETPAHGRIYTWTRTWQPFAPEFADHTPYVTVLVELPEAGHRRLAGLLLGDQHADPLLGEAVEGVIQLPCEATGGVPVLRWQRSR